MTQSGIAAYFTAAGAKIARRRRLRINIATEVSSNAVAVASKGKVELNSAAVAVELTKPPRIAVNAMPLLP